MGRGCLGWSAKVYMSSGMFRGKESSNRNELSRLVQDLLNLEFWAPCGSGGWWMGVGGGWGVPSTHVHMHAHAHMVNMIISCKWPPPLGESLGIPYDVIRMCVCMHICACVCVCMCVGGTLSPTPTHIHPPPTPQGGGPPESVKIQ